MKKIAVPVESPDLDAEVGSRFGRTGYFLLVDPATMAWSAAENAARDAGGGAGPQTAQFLAEHGVDGVIAVEFGPNADEALRMAGIPMYHCDRGTTVRDAVERLGKGELPQPERQSAGGGGWVGGMRGRGGGRGRGRGRGWGGRGGRGR